MKREDALKVWEDLTRELWPDADPARARLRIEHAGHLEILLENIETTDGYGACAACAVRFNTFAHAADCPLMAAWGALDDPHGHAEVGRAFDEGSGFNRIAYTAQSAPLRFFDAYGRLAPLMPAPITGITY